MHTTRGKSRSARVRRPSADSGAPLPAHSQRLGELVAAQEQERHRIARELHDQMGQHVVALSLGLARLAGVDGSNPDASEIIRRLQGVTDVLGRDVHRLALELRPSALDHLGLAVAICNFAEDTAVRSGLEIDTHCQDIRELQLPSAVETAIYRIAQEALTNVVKHARAQRVSVILEPRHGAVLLIVEDDGIGFEPEDLRRKDPRERLGLAGMHERAGLIGGVVSIESTLGKGTTLYLRLPLAATPGPP